MHGIHYLCVSLLLSTVAQGGYPDFGDGDDSWYVCEGDACTDSLIWLFLEKTVQVPNRSVTYEEYNDFEVGTEGLLADCAASLTIGDIATDMKTCRVVQRKYRQACNYRKKGWLEEDGKTFKESLDKDFGEIAGVSENILKCLDWDGVYDDYDYDYYDYGFYDSYYGYHYLEESVDTEVRKKRDLQSNFPEFLLQSKVNRTKRSAKISQNMEKKGKEAKKGTSEDKKGKRKDIKNKTRKRRKRLNRNKHRSNKRAKGQGRKQFSHKSKKRGDRKRSGRKRKSGHKKGGATKKKKGKGKSHKTKTRSKKYKKNLRKQKKNGSKGKKEDKKKKKKEKERKLLKSIGYNSKPSKETLNKLWCVERAIMYGLEKCGQKIFKEIA